jgi:hypothetical protein
LDRNFEPNFEVPHEARQDTGREEKSRPIPPSELLIGRVSKFCAGTVWQVPNVVNETHGHVWD